MSAHQTGAGGFGTARPPAGMPVPGDAAPVESFTPEMRDRQARGKDPYDSSEGSSGDWPSESGKNYRKGGSSRNEAFSTVERRRMAAQILDSPELLMMAAQRDNDSIPATRLRYMRMLCGLEPFSKKPQRGGVSTSRVATPGRSSRKDAR
ncbi:uncharacterized protein GGS22DRAFT_163466 [Annulohypoxylon maeteangense]|uniref:uncharacterized protein n=1 Tax=Annulohypoxylon maeteangense TaxID=1927788 RepID=UPI00200770CA|nr:uncharacterized protein GGS22DRAFT_163466 [Annulohypoxylon maeteangense]KAI0885341.1 hypothetical protein GGS22DRAFT_163466 [Annulohypoxylon maeteangense]